MIDFVQRTLLAIDHVGTAFHRYRVKTAESEGASQVCCGGTFSFRVQDTVGFHCADQVAVLFPASVKNTGIGVPAVHEDISAHTIWERADDVQGHIDFRSVLRAASFQGIAQ